jgi:hypothetical protein
VPSLRMGSCPIHTRTRSPQAPVGDLPSTGKLPKRSFVVFWPPFPIFLFGIDFMIPMGEWK